ncbi:ATP-binding protein [Companilactobacillus suantsaicola]|uniref:ATP-binding protein n=1 Tax=Companilactobacillus suantsaicola TaxID=2487723 RepID=A0A4Z0JL32_9LACO|nr:AAA family ATPase [Companilactobacillus suantsaicola]TGD22828.1 ATP-binding protein [Companilactobacillus suantsaicola]
MELLRFKIDGLKLYENNQLDFDFVASQRATDGNSDSLNNIFNRIYTHNVLSIVGINAVGKTTTLRMISEIINTYVSGKALSDKDVFIGTDFKFTVYLFDEILDKIFKIESNVKNIKSQLTFETENVYEKGVSGVNKKNIFEFNENNLILTRESVDSSLLPDNYSVFRKIINDSEHKSKIKTEFYYDGYFSANYLLEQKYVSPEIMRYLDPSIEKFEVIDDGSDVESIDKKQFVLKFYGSPAIKITEVSDLKRYFSAGTLKGISLFTVAELIIESGSTLLVDEIENHFNKAIVRTLIDMFRNEKTNRKHATLIFTTHYPELLDMFDRNDDIYVARREGKMTVDNLAKLLNRNDLKRSEVFESNYLGGTAPSYDLMMSLKKTFENRFGK